MIHRFHPEKVRQFFFLVLLVALGGVLAWELRGFVSPFLGAVTLYVLMRKYMRRLVDRGWKPAPAALLLMIVSLIVIMLPIYGLIHVLAARVPYVIQHAQELTASVVQYIKDLETQFHYKLLSEDNVRRMSTLAIQQLPSVLNATFTTLFDLVALYFILFFLLTGTHRMERWLEDILPLRAENLALVRKEIRSMVVSNAVGIPLIALAQGIVGLIAYLAVGVNEPLMWFALTCFASMLPVVGAALAYVPLAVIQFFDGHHVKGIIILAYGLLIIGLTDNVFRMVFQRKIGDVHPLITVFGVIVGIPLFGFIGLIFGPLMISMFILLARIYYVEFVIPDERIE